MQSEAGEKRAVGPGILNEAGTRQTDALPKAISFRGWSFWCALLVFLIDQVSKAAIDHFCPIGYCHNVIPGFFNLVHYRNTGSAWGMFSNHTWILGGISLLAFAAFIAYFKRICKDDFLTALAMSVFIGGIAGNMVDRICRHSVIDFIDVYVSGHHWPAFNIADSAICVAVGALVVLSYISEKRAGKRA